jgi:predicted flap endonuclease-1-like 5' DNA nuclease
MLRPMSRLVLLSLCTCGVLLLALLLFWLLTRRAKPDEETKPATRAVPRATPGATPQPEPVPAPPVVAPEAKEPFTIWKEPAAEPTSAKDAGPEAEAVQPFTVWKEPAAQPKPAKAAPPKAAVPQVEAVQPFTVWREPVVASESASAAPATRKATPRVKADDLKVVEGIGPKVNTALNKAGIRTFAQLAKAPVDQLREIVQAAGWSYMDPTTWPEQATLAAKADWDGLKSLQGKLKGGRRA